MSQKKIISVFGATGAQGGGVARSILNDKNSEFTVRAVKSLTLMVKERQTSVLPILGCQLLF